MQTKFTKALVAWLLTGAVLIFTMVIIGGITRLTGSGLSIVEWNVISGTFPPMNEAQWQLAFQQYQQFPEYQKVNFSITLAGFKQLFWWEYLHRLLGRVLGVVFLIPYFFFLLKGSLSTALKKRLFVILLMGMAQGVMGWLMVKSGLVDNPHVSHYRLAAHLCLALTLIGTILWTVADLLFPVLHVRNHPKTLASFSKVVLGAIVVQIILGAFVAGLKAGFSYNTFPLMNGEFFPVLQVELLQERNYLENGPFLQFLHRWWGVAVLLLLGWFWKRSFATQITTSCRKLIFILFLIGLGQVVLGIATLVFQVPVTLGVLHQGVGVLLFCFSVLTVHQLKPSVKHK